jgi:hypothetical protein
MKALAFAVTVLGVASVAGCNLCLLPCVVCAELSAPQLQMRADPLPEVGPVLIANPEDAAPGVLPAK